MCTPNRPFSLVLAAILAGCGGGSLTLPSDTSPAALQAVSGDGQQGTVGTKLNAPLVVKVTDASSRPVSGIPIVFQFTSNVPNAQVSPTEAATDSSGIASAQVRLGTTAGAHQVEARVASTATLSATFLVTAVAPPKKGRSGRGGDDNDD